MITETDINDYKQLGLQQPTGVKYDQEKPRFDLIDPIALEGLAKVLTHGANKYAAHNWRGGIAYSRIISALMRHLNAIQRGEDIDPDSLLPHVDHIGCNWMFLSHFMACRPDLDDRPKKPLTEKTVEQVLREWKTNERNL